MQVDCPQSEQRSLPGLRGDTLAQARSARYHAWRARVLPAVDHEVLARHASALFSIGIVGATVMAPRRPFAVPHHIPNCDKMTPRAALFAPLYTGACSPVFPEVCVRRNV